MAFDPDEYLKKLEGPKSEFNPDAYLEKITPKDKSALDAEVPVIGGTPRGYIKGALNTLPVVGTIGGGALGLAGGPATVVGGAGLGAAAGEALKNIGEKFILDEDKTREDIYAGPAKAAIEGATAEMGGQVMGAGAKALAEVPAVKAGISKVGSGLAKVGETFSGVSKNDIQTYAKHADEIKSMASASDNSVAEAADQLRSKFQDGIKVKRAELNEQISSALSSSEKRIPINPIADALNSAKSKINSKLYPEQIDQIDGLIQKIKSLSDKKGTVSVVDAHDIKRFLQDEASSAYRNPGVFSLGTESAKAAKSGAAVARTMVDRAEPQVAASNSILSKLHDIEDNMNLNMIREGKPEASLLSAGTGGNQRNAKMLEELGALTDQDMVGDAQKLSAMRSFGSPKLLAQDMNGKAIARMAIPGALGNMAGGPLLGAAGALASSPMGVKVAVDSGRAMLNTASNESARPLIGMLANKIASPALSGMLKEEPKIEGIPVRMTMPVSPQDAEIARNQIKETPTISVVEKAKRLNMLNKHNRVVMGQ